MSKIEGFEYYLSYSAGRTTAYVDDSSFSDRHWINKQSISRPYYSVIQNDNMFTMNGGFRHVVLTSCLAQLSSNRETIKGNDEYIKFNQNHCLVKNR